VEKEVEEGGKEEEGAKEEEEEQKEEAEDESEKEGDQDKHQDHLMGSQNKVPGPEGPEVREGRRESRKGGRRRREKRGRPPRKLPRYVLLWMRSLLLLPCHLLSERIHEGATLAEGSLTSSA